MIEPHPLVGRVAAAARASGVDVAALLEPGELDQAIAELRSGGRAEDLLTLAWLEERRGDFEASLATLDRLAAGGELAPGARMLRARVLWLKSDLAAAREELAAIASSAPEDVAETARSELEILTASLVEREPVAEAARRLDVAFWTSVALVVALVAARSLRSIRRLARG